MLISLYDVRLSAGSEAARLDAVELPQDFILGRTSLALLSLYGCSSSPHDGSRLADAARPEAKGLHCSQTSKMR